MVSLCIKIFFTSFIFGLILFPLFIKLFKRLSKNGQPVRSCMSESYSLIKKDTPTMGGIVILISSLLPILFWIQLTTEVLLLMFIILLFALIGFVDDYLKLKTNSHFGLSAYSKILTQFLGTTISISIYKFYFAKDFTKTFLLHEVTIDFGYLYVLLVIFVIIGSSNAVNITDGVDGLAATLSITSFFFLGMISYLTQVNINIVLFCIAFVGAILSFLWFNIYPAKIFMGDVGSLSIGAALGSISVLVKRELLFFFIGNIFVIETLSVILQVLYFKYTKLKYGKGKRIFLMAPIHHHFEKVNRWSENEIVVKSLIINIIFSILAIAFLL